MIGAIVLALQALTPREGATKHHILLLNLFYLDTNEIAPFFRTSTEFSIYFENDLILSFLGFTVTIYLLGLIGMLFNYKNFLITMLAVELMYLGIVSSFVILGALGVELGPVYGLLILILAACESAIGLGILIVLYRFGGTVAFTDYEELGAATGGYGS